MARTRALAATYHFTFTGAEQRELTIDIRGQQKRARVVETPFYKRKKEGAA